MATLLYAVGLACFSFHVQLLIYNEFYSLIFLSPFLSWLPCCLLMGGCCHTFSSFGELFIDFLLLPCGRVTLPATPNQTSMTTLSSLGFSPNCFQLVSILNYKIIAMEKIKQTSHPVHCCNISSTQHPHLHNPGHRIPQIESKYITEAV